ncbi:hypothetical protein ACFX13_020495 [Malus domestica]
MLWFVQNRERELEFVANGGLPEANETPSFVRERSGSKRKIRDAVEVEQSTMIDTWAAWTNTLIHCAKEEKEGGTEKKIRAFPSFHYL